MLVKTTRDVRYERGVVRAGCVIDHLDDAEDGTARCHISMGYTVNLPPGSFEPVERDYEYVFARTVPPVGLRDLQEYAVNVEANGEFKLFQVAEKDDGRIRIDWARPVVIRPRHHDAPPPFVPLGEEGEHMVAYGHIPRRLAVVLAVAEHAATSGMAETDDRFFGEDYPVWDGLEAVLTAVRHVTAVEDMTEAFDGEGFVRWDAESVKDRPDTFPLTVIDMEAF